MLRGMGKPITLFGEGKVRPVLSRGCYMHCMLAEHPAWLTCHAWCSRSAGTGFGSCWPPWMTTTWMTLWPVPPWRFTRSWPPGPTCSTLRAHQPSDQLVHRCSAALRPRSSLGSHFQRAQPDVLQIAHFSLLRAAQRLDHAKRKLSNPDENIVEERRESHDTARWAHTAHCLLSGPEYCAPTLHSCTAASEYGTEVPGPLLSAARHGRADSGCAGGWPTRVVSLETRGRLPPVPSGQTHLSWQWAPGAAWSSCGACPSAVIPPPSGRTMIASLVRPRSHERLLPCLLPGLLLPVCTWMHAAVMCMQHVGAWLLSHRCPACSAGLAWHPGAGRGLPDGAAHLATGGADSCAKLWTADGQASHMRPTISALALRLHASTSDRDVCINGSQQLQQVACQQPDTVGRQLTQC